MAMKTHQTITKVQAEAAPKLAKMEAAAAEKVSKHRDDGDGVPPPTPARARAANYAPTSHQPVCCAAQSPLCGFVFRVACVFLAHGAGVTVRDLLPRNNGSPHRFGLRPALCFLSAQAKTAAGKAAPVAGVGVGLFAKLKTVSLYYVPAPPLTFFPPLHPLLRTLTAALFYLLFPLFLVGSAHGSIRAESAFLRGYCHLCHV